MTDICLSKIETKINDVRQLSYKNFTPQLMKSNDYNVNLRLIMFISSCFEITHLGVIHRRQISVRHNSSMQFETIDTVCCKGILEKSHKFLFKTNTIRPLFRGKRENFISTCRKHLKVTGKEKQTQSRLSLLLLLLSMKECLKTRTMNLLTNSGNFIPSDHLGKSSSA